MPLSDYQKQRRFATVAPLAEFGSPVEQIPCDCLVSANASVEKACDVGVASIFKQHICLFCMSSLCRFIEGVAVRVVLLPWTGAGICTCCPMISQFTVALPNAGSNVLRFLSPVKIARDSLFFISMC